MMNYSSRQMVALRFWLEERNQGKMQRVSPAALDSTTVSYAGLKLLEVVVQVSVVFSDAC